MLTLEVLRHLWPNGDHVVHGLVEGIAASAPTIFPKYGLNNNLTIAHAMAQFSEECGAGMEMVENLNYSAQRLVQVWPTRFNANKATQVAHNPKLIANTVYNGRMGNRLGTDDGWNFRGRGLSQTTGREAYQSLGTKLGLNLVDNPDLINDPQHALECGVADFVMCGCLPYALADNVVVVTKRLNGGFIGLPERKSWLAKWKTALSV